MFARGPGGPGNGVPRSPVRWEGCPRSGVDGSLLSVWTAVRATNSTRLSSVGAGGASILMPPLLEGLPNIIRIIKVNWMNRALSWKRPEHYLIINQWNWNAIKAIVDELNRVTSASKQRTIEYNVMHCNATTLLSVVVCAVDLLVNKAPISLLNYRRLNKQTNNDLCRVRKVVQRQTWLKENYSSISKLSEQAQWQSFKLWPFKRRVPSYWF